MNTQQKLTLRIILIIIMIGILGYTLLSDYFFTAVMMLVVVAVLLAEMLTYINKVFGYYNRTISAMLHDDFSADFSNHKNYQNYQELFSLYGKLKKQRGETLSKDQIYRSILNHLETGIVILQVSGGSWEIMLMNEYFSSYFKIPKVTHWKYLQKMLPQLCEIIEKENFAELKTPLQIKPSQQELQTFILQTSRSKTFGREYYVIMLDSIQKVVERREREAWNSLMKVISHELLNSLTPIRSLSQHIEQVVQQDDFSEEDISDIKLSMSAIRRRSDHLQQFAESYRKLAMLPSPNRKELSLKALVSGSLQLMRPLATEAGVTLINSIGNDYSLYADASQLEQVIINLISNAIHALSESGIKEIEIFSEVKNNRLYLRIADSGKGIDKEIEDKIFLPFYTTRQGGSGIGLTLSKNIIEAHGGYLTFYRENEKTVFVVCL
ncbi:MAG: HAMP domain-containing sensor histidine kinase [Capnocytophaga sp.]|nr:HAMP domain-containing sensor histidine kinase [Capnocytophaga sp.]